MNVRRGCAPAPWEKAVHDPRPSKAAGFRQQAEDIRKVARQISLKDQRNKLLESAELLEFLAAEEDYKAGQAPSRTKPDPEA